MQQIFSRDAAFQKFEVLKTNRNKRHKYRQFLVEGVRNINAAVKYGWHIDAFIYARSAQLSGWARNMLHHADMHYALTAELMAEISAKEETSEMLAIVHMRDEDFAMLKLPENPLIAVFDRPGNPGNLGSVIRSCDALGVHALIITGHAVDLYDPGVILASTGSIFALPCVRMPDILPIARGFQLIGTDEKGDRLIRDVDFTRPTMILIGNETLGLSRALKDSCDVLARIPMNPHSYASSLNAACAATSVLYEAAMQRLG